MDETWKRETHSQGPTFWQPVTFALFAGGAMAASLQALALDTLRIAGQSGTEPGLLALPVTQPLLHLVVLPVCFFLCYTLVQVVGYRGELTALYQGRQGRFAAASMVIAGRASPLARGYPNAARYRAIQRRNDRRLLRPVEFGVGTLTMLGLLGTIIGLSLALQDLPAVMDPASGMAERKQVLGSLGFAFATTIAGIVGSLVLSLFRLYLTNMGDRAEAIVEDRAGSSPP